ncbi:MAG: OsmC family protein [Candidatus Zixiibacteriota bacterium]
MKTTISKRMNGLDTTQLFETVEHIKGQPELAKFRFRASNWWIGGTVNRSTVQGFYGAGREDDSRKVPFEFTSSEPPILLGNNEGANVGEALLHALAGCITTTTVLHATARGIKIESISSELEGDIDVQGVLGLDESVPVGFSEIRVRMKISADCTAAELDELMEFSKLHSPIFNSVTRPVPVQLGWNKQ